HSIRSSRAAKPFSGSPESAGALPISRGQEPRRYEWMLPSTTSLKQTGGRELKRIVFDEETIARRVRELGQEITAAYPDGELLVLGLLKGSFIFLSDLVRRIERPLQVDFLVAASYGGDTISSGNVRLLYDPETELRGKHILLVEDIVDTGKTLNRLVSLLRERAPRSLEICALLHKHLAPHLELEAGVVGVDAPRVFLVGDGLDHAENFRHLPYLARLPCWRSAARRPANSAAPGPAGPRRPGRC